MSAGKEAQMQRPCLANLTVGDPPRLAEVEIRVMGTIILLNKADDFDLTPVEATAALQPVLEPEGELEHDDADERPTDQRLD